MCVCVCGNSYTCRRRKRRVSKLASTEKFRSVSPVFYATRYALWPHRWPLGAVTETTIPDTGRNRRSISTWFFRKEQTGFMVLPDDARSKSKVSGRCIVSRLIFNGPFGIVKRDILVASGCFSLQFRWLYICLFRIKR